MCVAQFFSEPILSQRPRKWTLKMAENTFISKYEEPKKPSEEGRMIFRSYN